MKRVVLFVLLAAVALPAFAQSSEFGVLFGGSRRFIRENDRNPDVDYDLSGFEFSSSTLDVYYGFELEPGTMFKVKAGKIEGPVAFDQPVPADVEGELQHLSGIVEFVFSEPFGSTGLFGGVGLYRLEAPDFSSETSWGFSLGVNGDFPLSRRYGVIVEGAYHWTQFDVRQRFLTVGAGLRIAF